MRILILNEFQGYDEHYVILVNCLEGKKHHMKAKYQPHHQKFMVYPFLLRIYESRKLS